MKFRTAIAAIALVATSTALPMQAHARTQVRAVGSSTVYPFAKAVAERMARANPGTPTPIIESTGTGGGMKLFCGGIGERFPDIANASRRIKSSELKSCSATGVKQITEIQVGIDGIAFATAKATGLSNLTVRDVYAAIAKMPFGKPNKAKTWKDVNAQLPAIPIRVYGPPPTSGTRDALVELLMTPGCETNAGMKALKSSNADKHKAICIGVREDGAFVEAGENDNLIVQKIAGTPGTVGIFGYSYLEENGDKLKGLSLNGVTPSYDNIAQFKYPGARPLYIYVKNAHAKAIPSIRSFVAEFTKESTWGRNGYLARLGLIAAPDAVRQRNAQAARTFAPLNFAAVK
ncbi:substrate-binding domain-containing protein [Sphingosinicella rhizophila]|uniref:Substrate-binding domain-containing protein n=1 Tax=Sphingosinicella rhizophila TaxID=3050082 RepID=A0ABU3QBX5_9SPHN|nr:substrate-binding domain-containing protein [Sphingosinicella sp. GR2756]MDT9600905.1 substrate-binding domain-containing protein [Sphingosinicella sp. GR2756]